MPSPALEEVTASVERLHVATEPVVVRVAAPVLLLCRVLEADLCRRLILYWQARDKLASIVGSDAGNVVDVNTKRRLDVNLDDPALFTRVRDALVRRVAPAIEQASHVRTSVIETPRIGCYDALTGGRFRRHRDNTSRQTAPRQFAISVNLNPDDEYDGGELRFPEFGRQLYRPAIGCAVVFSSTLLHEVNPVMQGRRFGLFTFLSSAGWLWDSVPAAPVDRGLLIRAGQAVSIERIVRAGPSSSCNARTPPRFTSRELLHCCLLSVTQT